MKFTVHQVTVVTQDNSDTVTLDVDLHGKDDADQGHTLVYQQAVRSEWRRLGRLMREYGGTRQPRAKSARQREKRYRDALMGMVVKAAGHEKQALKETRGDHGT